MQFKLQLAPLCLVLLVTLLAARTIEAAPVPGCDPSADGTWFHRIIHLQVDC